MGEPTLSIVIPCLNEADTLALCIRQARLALARVSVAGEILVADNGSGDGSPELAEREGARLVRVAERGYGAALMGGIAAARGRWIVMGDADASYDFADTPRFTERLAAGDELVLGCRLPAGGGRVTPGAMPWLHRWIGNPLFSALARHWYGVPVHDIHCGMRGFTRDLYERIDLQCTGMEFASEMVIKAAVAGARMSEVAITLHPDQRHAHPPHLRTFRDGWRHLRFYLLFSPRWLFGMPGLVLVTLGLVAGVLAYPGTRVGRIGFDVHTLLFAGLFVILGSQMMLFGVLARDFAVRRGLLPASRRLARATRWLRMEPGILLGMGCITAGLVLLGTAVLRWKEVDFGALDYERTMRIVIPGASLAAIGLQVILTSFLLGVFALPHRSPSPAADRSLGGTP